MKPNNQTIKLMKETFNKQNWSRLKEYSAKAPYTKKIVFFYEKVRVQITYFIDAGEYILWREFIEENVKTK